MSSDLLQTLIDRRNLLSLFSFLDSLFFSCLVGWLVGECGGCCIASPSKREKTQTRMSFSRGTTECTVFFYRFDSQCVGRWNFAFLYNDPMRLQSRHPFFPFFSRSCLVQSLIKERTSDTYPALLVKFCCCVAEVTLRAFTIKKITFFDSLF